MKRIIVFSLAAGLLLTPSARPQTLTKLADLQNAQGKAPWSTLVQGSDGNLYGTTMGGGAGYGTIFEVSPGGALRRLAAFSRTNGAYPYEGLVQAGDGSYYGTTQSGGDHGLGTLFRLTRERVLVTVVNFSGETGGSSFGHLLAGAEGNLYGTTSSQGGPGVSYFGTVFELASQGSLKTLAAFNGTNGSAPWAGVVRDGVGNLYGTTAAGPSSGSGSRGQGTVFKLAPDGTLSTLAIFGGTNGGSPESGLVLAKDGDLYGTTVGGGKFGFGTVFRVTPAGELTTLVDFDRTNGAYLYSGLIQATDGNFYGTTSEGGDLSLNGGRGDGTAFKMTPDGVLATMVKFNGANGAGPVRGLLQARDGNLYGTTAGGGLDNAGRYLKNHRVEPAAQHRIHNAPGRLRSSHGRPSPAGRIACSTGMTCRAGAG